jgi:transposase
MKISRSAYTAEFKELAVKRVKAGESISTTAQELGMSDQTLRNWIKAASAGKLSVLVAKALTPEYSLDRYSVCSVFVEWPL